MIRSGVSVINLFNTHELINIHELINMQQLIVIDSLLCLMPKIHYARPVSP